MSNQLSPPRTRLEAELRTRSWGRERALDLPHRKAHELGLTGFTLGLRQCDRYLAAESTRVRPVTAEVMRAVFGLPAAELPATGPSPADTDPLGERASRDHAMPLAAGGLSEASIEQLRAEVRRHARDYAHLPPAFLPPRLLRTRDLACTLLESARRPRHATVPLSVAGRVCGLAATTAYDLGDPDAAEDHARAAGVYADPAEEPGPAAWVRGTRATIAFRNRRPREALEHAAGGLTHASGAGTADVPALQEVPRGDGPARDDRRLHGGCPPVTVHRLNGSPMSWSVRTAAATLGRRGGGTELGRRIS